MTRVRVDGEEVKVDHGPWRYEDKKIKRHGYGEYITIRDNEHRDHDTWLARIGVHFVEELYGKERVEIIDD